MSAKPPKNGRWLRASVGVYSISVFLAAVGVASSIATALRQPCHSPSLAGHMVTCGISGLCGHGPQRALGRRGLFRGLPCVCSAMGCWGLGSLVSLRARDDGWARAIGLEFLRVSIGRGG